MVIGDLTKNREVWQSKNENISYSALEKIANNHGLKKQSKKAKRK